MSPIELVHEYDTYECDAVHIKDDYRLWFDNLYRILAGFTRLDRLYVKRYGSVFSEWSGFLLEEIMRRNRNLKEITLCAMGATVKFNLDSLVESSGILANLWTLDSQGALFSDVTRRAAMSETGFPRLSNLIIKCSMKSLPRDLSVLSILSILSNCHITSLYIDADTEIDEVFEEDVAAAFTSPQCADIFKHLRDLHIDSSVAADQWFQWIGPFCPNLKSFTLTTCAEFSPDVLNFIPNKVQTLDVRIFSTFDEIIRWLVCLLKVSSSGWFLELNSLRIFFVARPTCEFGELSRIKLSTESKASSETDTSF